MGEVGAVVQAALPSKAQLSILLLVSLKLQLQGFTGTWHQAPMAPYTMALNRSKVKQMGRRPLFWTSCINIAVLTTPNPDQDSS